MEDCNTCFCGPHGQYTCTKMVCIYLPDAPPPSAREKRQAVGEECDEGQSYFDGDGCNTCTCYDNHYLCTEKPCFSPSDDSASARRKREEAPLTSVTLGCSKGSIYDDGCNTCLCVNDKFYACTQRSCSEEREFPETVPEPARH